MLLTRTIAVPPSETQPLEYLEKCLLNYKSPQDGFILKVNMIEVKDAEISTEGNIVYKIMADVECWLPAAGMTVQAVVETQRGTAHAAIALDVLQIIFDSEKAIPKGARVECMLTKVQYQRGMHKATAELTAVIS